MLKKSDLDFIVEALKAYDCMPVEEGRAIVKDVTDQHKASEKHKAGLCGPADYKAMRDELESRLGSLVEAKQEQRDITLGRAVEMRNAAEIEEMTRLSDRVRYSNGNYVVSFGGNILTLSHKRVLNSGADELYAMVKSALNLAGSDLDPGSIVAELVANCKEVEGR